MLFNYTNEPIPLQKQGSVNPYRSAFLIQDIIPNSKINIVCPDLHNIA